MQRYFVYRLNKFHTLTCHLSSQFTKSKVLNLFILQLQKKSLTNENLLISSNTYRYIIHFTQNNLLFKFVYYYILVAVNCVIVLVLKFL